VAEWGEANPVVDETVRCPVRKKVPWSESEIV
jgi:hypothetical protein